jgi:hypothetical protein
MSSKDERRKKRDADRAIEEACADRDAHMERYEPIWYTERTNKTTDQYKIWRDKLIRLSQLCKGSIPERTNNEYRINRNVCEEDIGDLSDILYQLNLGQLGGKKGGSKQTGGAVTPALLTQLNGWIYRHKDEISDCAKYFLEKIYRAISTIINETTLHQDSHTFQFLITLISYLNQDVPLPGEEMVNIYIQKFLFQNIQAVSDLQQFLSELQTTISQLSLRDLAYYILLGINLYQYVDPAKGVVLGVVDTISVFSNPLIAFIQSEDFLKLLYNISQSGILTAGLLVSAGFKSLSLNRQNEIKNIYTLIDINIARLIVAEYIKSGYTQIDKALADRLIRSNYAILLEPLTEHLKETLIDEKMANAIEIAKITNEIQIAKYDINDASSIVKHNNEIKRLNEQLNVLTNQLIAILPQLDRGGKRGKSTRRKIGSRKNKRVQKKKSTKKR